MKSKIDLDILEKRLDEAFNEDGVVGGKLLKVIKAEEGFSIHVSNNYNIYHKLTGSFLSFFMQTLEIAEHYKNTKKQKTGIWYVPLLLDQTTTFRVFRAAENLLFKGYPLSGYSILREVKDRAIVYGAIANNITNYEKSYGIGGMDLQKHQESSKEKWDEIKVVIKKNRKKEEQRIFKKMLGSESGMPKKHQKELLSWIEDFHLEVHGSRFSYVDQGLNWISGQSKFPILPELDRVSISLYMYTSNKIGWMLLRALTFLQPIPKAFGEEWCKKWQILDESFLAMMEVLKETREEIANSFKYFIKNKFNFAPDRTFYKE
jgi:hypothetical protein